jgi:hypothetical protein
VVLVRPNPKVLGYTPAGASAVTRVAGQGTGSVGVRILDSKLVPDNHVFKITFNTNPEDVHPTSYNLIDTTDRKVVFKTGDDFEGANRGISGLGIQPVVSTLATVLVDTVSSGFAAGSQTNAKLRVVYDARQPINLRRTGFPYDLTITFSNVVLDTALALFDELAPVKFKVIAHAPTGDVKLRCKFTDLNGDSTLSPNPSSSEEIQVLTGPDSLSSQDRVTWKIRIKNDSTSTVGPTLGDAYNLKLLYPFSVGDVFTFKTSGELIADASAKESFKGSPYVVPNPYVGAASFEPDRFATSGRGERRLEFRGLPQNCTVRIYTVRGELVQTLRHDGSNDGFVPWNLRTKDNLDVAPGLYIYHVDAGQFGDYIGKFAIIK